MIPPLRPGETVELRPPAEVLATLDESGSLAGLPFMPEMMQYFGRRYTIAKRVEKICDTICPISQRRMRDTVFLEDLRCSGAMHGGCEGECRIYWKTAWLRRAPATDDAPRPPDPADLAELESFVRARIHQPDANRQRFRCQATEARRATEPLGTWEPAQYAREIACGNVTVGRFLRVAAQATGSAVTAKLRHFLGQSAVRRPKGNEPQEQSPPLGLQPGEWVEVKSAEEILATLDDKLTNRGLFFAPAEMLPACGKRFRVRRRVTKLVDESTGRMLSIKKDCIALEGFVCTGDRSHRRWFCAREIFPYWREAWLRRVTLPD